MLRPDAIIDESFAQGPAGAPTTAVLVSPTDVNGFVAHGGATRAVRISPARARRFLQRRQRCSCSTSTEAGLTIVLHRGRSCKPLQSYALRKRARPTRCLADTTTVGTAHSHRETLHAASYKGVTDIVTKYMSGRRSRFPITRLLAQPASVIAQPGHRGRAVAVDPATFVPVLARAVPIAAGLACAPG